jgi:hypothetical protein
VFSARNAEYQVCSMSVGSNIASLSPGETQLAGQISGKTTGLTRSWEYWSMRVANKASAGAPGKAAAKPASKKAKPAAKPARAKAKAKRATRKRRR